ncbi:MAG: hypothetical protein JNJ94_01180 [Chlorobi bacterium]|nr:hypothetical protein [Chlorobiota bacterium]
MLKRRFIWFLTLLFALVPLITAAQEGTSAPRRTPQSAQNLSQKRKKHKSYQKKPRKKLRKKSQKKPRKKLRKKSPKKSYRKKYVSKKPKRGLRPVARRSAVAARPAVAAARPAASKADSPTASVTELSKKQKGAKTHPKLSAKLTLPAPAGWRANVRRTVATTTAGTVAPFEAFPTLGGLLRTLPDQGEVRVRYGIYPGVKDHALAKRFDQERRNVTVTCWLHGVRYDSASADDNDREVQLLIGTTADTATATIMFARIPGPLRGVGAALQDEFTIAREQLADVVGERPAPQWRWITPRQVAVEGGLFFNGLRDPGIRNDAQRDPSRPLTVWEITPVISVTPINLAE